MSLRICGKQISAWLVTSLSWQCQGFLPLLQWDRAGPGGTAAEGQGAAWAKAEDTWRLHVRAVTCQPDQNTVQGSEFWVTQQNNTKTLRGFQMSSGGTKGKCPTGFNIQLEGSPFVHLVLI